MSFGSYYHFYYIVIYTEIIWCLFRLPLTSQCRNQWNCFSDDFLYLWLNQNSVRMLVISALKRGVEPFSSYVTRKFHFSVYTTFVDVVIPWSNVWYKCFWVSNRRDFTFHLSGIEEKYGFRKVRRISEAELDCTGNYKINIKITFLTFKEFLASVSNRQLHCSFSH